MTWIQWLAVFFIASVVSSPFIGHYLHNRRINAEWNQWLYDERQGRLERLQQNYDIADAITRTDVEPRVVHQINNSSDDADGFMLDYDDQPKRAS